METKGGFRTFYYFDVICKIIINVYMNVIAYKKVKNHISNNVTSKFLSIYIFNKKLITI